MSGERAWKLGRLGLQHGLDPRQSLAPDLLALAVEERGEHLERADWDRIALERHLCSLVRPIESQSTLRPHWPNLRLELDHLVGHDLSKPRHRLPDLA